MHEDTFRNSSFPIFGKAGPCGRDDYMRKRLKTVLFIQFLPRIFITI